MPAEIPKMNTGVPGLDDVLSGGLPMYSINIVTGQPGAGKTIFTHQIIFSNLEEGQKALYLTTLSEPAIKMLRYMQEFSFIDPARLGTDVTYLDIGEVIQEKGLDETLQHVLELVKTHRPSIVAIDSFKAIHDLAANDVESRQFGFNLAVSLATWGVTTFLIGEYVDRLIQEEPIFAIADSIITLRYERSGLHYRRFIDVQKLRGANFFEGRHPYTISEDGLRVYPRIRTPRVLPDYHASTERIQSHVPELDEMLGGGIPLGTATMIAGGAGTGKTLLGMHFVTAAADRGEPSVIVSFQENPAQLTAISGSYGWDLDQLKTDDLIEHLYHSPVELQPDIHFHRVREAVERIGAKIVLIDSLKDIEIATPDKIRYKDYVYSLVNEFRLKGITTLMTNEIPELFGPFQLSEFGVSFMADNVILLRYVELSGIMSRAINIMKVRGSRHSKEFREFEITDEGARILEPIRAFSGILTGTPTLNSSTALMNMPHRTRFVAEILRQNGPQETAAICDLTGLQPASVEEELLWLQDHRLVNRMNVEERELYAVNF